jgi:hypothetical protein
VRFLLKEKRLLFASHAMLFYFLSRAFTNLSPSHDEALVIAKQNPRFLFPDGYQ